MTSPESLVPKAHHVCWAMLLLMNRTLPSAIPTFTPPGWLLAACGIRCRIGCCYCDASSVQSAQKYCGELGVTSVWKVALPSSASIHSLP